MQFRALLQHGTNILHGFPSIVEREPRRGGRTYLFGDTILCNPAVTLARHAARRGTIEGYSGCRLGVLTLVINA